jgi:hypothetical protein
MISKSPANKMLVIKNLCTFLRQIFPVIGDRGKSSINREPRETN